jgi:hypothetical protein
LRIIPSSELLGASLPTSFTYPQSVSGDGLQLSCWVPLLQDQFSTINPVQTYELPVPPHQFHTILSFLTHSIALKIIAHEASSQNMEFLIIPAKCFHTITINASTTALGCKQL